MAQCPTQLLPNLWHNLSTSVLVLDQDFKIFHANNSSSELLGLGLKRFVGQPFDDLFSHHHITSINRIKSFIRSLNIWLVVTLAKTKTKKEVIEDIKRKR